MLDPSVPSYLPLVGNCLSQLSPWPLYFKQNSNWPTGLNVSTTGCCPLSYLPSSCSMPFSVGGTLQLGHHKPNQKKAAPVIYNDASARCCLMCLQDQHIPWGVRKDRGRLTCFFGKMLRPPWKSQNTLMTRLTKTSRGGGFNFI